MAETTKKPAGEVKFIPLLICLAIGLVLWFITPPSGLDVKAWHLFAIFVATIVGLIIKPLPLGSVAILSLTIIVLTNTLTLEQSLSGFQNTTIWLIVIAFFISRGFIKTGLGTRVAYIFVRLFGKKTLGLSYSLIVSDLLLSPAMPSNTARAGGIILPIIRSLSETYGSRTGDGTERRVGAFLTKVSFQGDMITSAMFVTAMAANPLAVKMTEQITGKTISWVGWATAAIVPGIISLIVIPLVIYKLYPPELKETPEASEIAAKKLNEMGPLKKEEWYMIGVFLLLLVLWIFGANLNINATTTAFIGLCALLLTQVLSWSDIKKEQGAWDTLVWFAVLVMMATFLNDLGMIPWFSDLMKGTVSHMSWMTALIVLAIAYFYSHYFFASNTAHVSAMYAAFLSVIVAAGAPPLLSALILAFFSNLFGCLTHYGSGPAPVFFGSGYVTQQKWWSLGFLISIIHIIIWIGIGGLWWKLLGLW
ncbi:anion permease [Priestia megaterium]|uniref:anion permease n=1 Tax=Priestia megaterium TaxID=1404 RepID=UPI000D50BCBA|nr:anion permease [Priestia megaterium]PVE71760.1 anion permease [Priestia megaterium]PVE80864.1 anion permease [Priestia megaterium]PVE92019.1 anion permease [Priestia megaterium]PVE95334.1 anion permease [Priestia megaterium]